MSTAPSAIGRRRTIGGIEGRLERQARNEALLREVNERIAELNARLPASADTPQEFHCECGALPGCDSLVSMLPADYERVRAQDDRFAVVPGHENLELESVVERTDAWVIVDKLAQFDSLVADDPRGNPSS